MPGSLPTRGLKPPLPSVPHPDASRQSPVAEELVLTRTPAMDLAPMDLLEVDLPEFSLRQAEVLSQGQRASLLDVFDLHGLQVTGYLERVEPEQQHLVLDSNLITRRIAIDRIRRWSYWRAPAGDIQICVLGQAGWFRLRPAQEYRQIFHNLTEGVDLLYFFAREASFEVYQKASFRKIETLCRSFVDYTHGLCEDVASALQIFQKHEVFIFQQLWHDTLAIGRKNNPIFEIFEILYRRSSRPPAGTDWNPPGEPSGMPRIPGGQKLTAIDASANQLLQKVKSAQLSGQAQHYPGEIQSDVFSNFGGMPEPNPDAPGSESNTSPSRELAGDSARVEVEEEEGESRSMEVDVYEELFLQSHAYGWQRNRIRRGAEFTTMGSSFPSTIRQTILDSFTPSAAVSTKDAPDIREAYFEFPWEPGEFCQDIGLDQKRVFDELLAITGSITDAYTATTRDYLSQVWPLTWEPILSMMQEITEDCSCVLFDSTSVEATLSSNDLVVRVAGSIESIAEVGEQLTWIVGTCHPSPYDDGIAICTPIIRITHGDSDEEGEDNSDEDDDEDEDGRSSRSTTPPPPVGDFAVQFEFERGAAVSGASQAAYGQCWHQLFRSPVLVKGYPIPRRPVYNSGLEAPLGIIARLAQSDYIDVFNSRIVIKGFCTLLVPTRLIGDTVVWHLVQTQQGQRISYFDMPETDIGDISFDELSSRRHIVGWCSGSRYRAGSECSNYNIDRSSLRGPHQKGKLNRVRLSQGRLIKPESPMIHRTNDRPVDLSRNPYRKRLSWISTKYVILWDVGEKRGWLVNGASALLHLLRASLEYDRTGDMKFAFLFAPEAFREAAEPYKANSPLSVLMDYMNLNLAIYDEGPDEGGQEKYLTIRDRVVELLTMLEKLIDHQIEIAGRNGEGFESVPRRYLEGWDFKDMATREDPIYPRTERLKPMAKGWVDFARSIHAVTLFGHGFGEIIHPSVDAALCSDWSTLPSKSYYLAVAIEDLQKIIDRFGPPDWRQPRVTESIVWYPRALNPRLMCKSLTVDNCCNLAQVMLPSSISSAAPPDDPSMREGMSAVVFGYNKGFAWRWPDHGRPEKSLLLSDGDSDSLSDDDDSGPGSSIRSPSRSKNPGAELGASSRNPSRGHHSYKIGIVCALEKELLAVRALLDQRYSSLPVDDNDSNCYALGGMNGHNVVAACLPLGVYGTNTAAMVASNMKRSFPAVKWYFVVGIGGGAPSPDHDIRLGDVVVSTSVIQSDLGKVIQSLDDLEMTGCIQQPDVFLRSVLSEIASDPHLPPNPLGEYISNIVELKPEFARPSRDDVLFAASSLHKLNEATCAKCTGETVKRDPRAESAQVHYGLVASSNQVVKDTVFRDYLGKRLQVLCFEMEAAGVFETAQCLVIRGICDYADSHKNKQWQEYAAATAAAYCKFFLSRLPSPSRLIDVASRPAERHSHSHQKRIASSSTDNTPTAKRSR